MDHWQKVMGDWRSTWTFLGHTFTCDVLREESWIMELTSQTGHKVVRVLPLKDTAHSDTAVGYVDSLLTSQGYRPQSR